MADRLGLGRLAARLTLRYVPGDEPAEKIVSEVGVIYVLKHQSGTTVKVGMTLVNSASRLSGYTKRYELKGFSHHRDFVVPASAVQEVERAAHRILAQYQLSGIESAREIFSCDTDTAEMAIEQAISDNQNVQRRKELENGYENAFRESSLYGEYQKQLDLADTILSRTIDPAETVPIKSVIASLVCAPFLFWFATTTESGLLYFILICASILSAFMFISISFRFEDLKSAKEADIRKREAKGAETHLMAANSIKAEFDKNYYA